jgi:hypothetical protein
MAQTEEIEYKSHSGNKILFEPSGQGKFGEIKPYKLSEGVTKHVDSVVVLCSQASLGNNQWMGSLMNTMWSFPNVTIDTVAQEDDTLIRFVGVEENNPPVSNSIENNIVSPTAPEKKEYKADEGQDYKRISGDNPSTTSDKTGILIGIILVLMSILVFWLSRTQNLTKHD